MKQTYLSICFLFLMISYSYAQPQQPQFMVQNGTTSLYASTLQDAYNQAQPGGTIYVPAGNYTDMYLYKKVNIVGAGYNPDSSSATGITHINNLYFYADSSTVTGVSSNSFYFGASGISAKRCKLSFCSFAYWSTPSNISVEECVIGSNVFEFSSRVNGLNNSGFQNIEFKKCIFIGNNYYGIINNVNFVQFTNNIFMSASNPSYYVYTLSSVNNSIFNNNVFIIPPQYYYQFANYSSNNLFNNNLFTGASFALPGSSNNDIFGQDESTLFVNVPPQSNWSSAYNYNLSASSPGNNAGTDATDIGIYGTATPFKDGGIPFNPHFQVISVPSSVGAGSPLNITIQVQGQQN